MWTAGRGKYWYYLARITGRDFQRGPISREEMIAKISWGDIKENTPVRFRLDSPWKTASDFDILKPHFKKRRKPIHLATGILTKIKIAGFIISLILISVLIRNYNYSRAVVPQVTPAPTVNIEAVQSILNSSTVTRDGIINETNRNRQENGLPSVSENDLLNRIATERLDDMFRKQYFAHISPTGEGEVEIAQRIGYRYKRLSENIASIGPYATDQKFTNGWMQSPGHRRNILDSEVTEIGVAVRKGYFRGTEAWVGVQIFGLQSSPVQ